MSDFANLDPRRLLEGEDGFQPFLAANTTALLDGLTVLESLSDELYVRSCKPAFQSLIGAHFRHLLEHYQCFLHSVKNGDQLICYDSRQRDVNIELHRVHAVRVSVALVEQLNSFEIMAEDCCYTVRDQQTLAPIATTIARELLFLQSHTVHHHAIIAAMCRILGHDVAENFGVAIATQAFNAEQQALAEQSIAPSRCLEAGTVS